MLYSRAQRTVLDDLVEDLTFLHTRVKNSVEKNERPEWTAATVDLVELYTRRAKARRTEADRGVQLSLAALREAMNLDPLLCLRIADEPIPQPNVKVCRTEILAAAISRRGEAIEASLATEVVGLEADAQGRNHRQGRDAPSPPAPTSMPVTFRSRSMARSFGPAEFRWPCRRSWSDRVPRTFESAQEYGEQAAAVAQKTRNLIVLESEEAYFSWQEWSKKVVLYRDAREVGLRLSGRLHEEFRGSIKRVIEGVLPESLLAAQARTDYNEALFRQAIALAALERVTGGGFLAELTAPSTPEDGSNGGAASPNSH